MATLARTPRWRVRIFRVINAVSRRAVQARWGLTESGILDAQIFNLGHQPFTATREARDAAGGLGISAAHRQFHARLALLAQAIPRAPESSAPGLAGRRWRKSVFANVDNLPTAKRSRQLPATLHRIASCRRALRKANYRSALGKRGALTTHTPGARDTDGFRFWSATAGDQLRQDLLGAGLGAAAGGLDRLECVGERAANHGSRIRIHDHRAGLELDGTVVDGCGQRGSALTRPG